jgi:hypothetical protein
LFHQAGNILKSKWFFSAHLKLHRDPNDTESGVRYEGKNPPSKLQAFESNILLTPSSHREKE